MRRRLSFNKHNRPKELYSTQINKQHDAFPSSTTTTRNIKIIMRHQSSTNAQPATVQPATVQLTKEQQQSTFPLPSLPVTQRNHKQQLLNLELIYFIIVTLIFTHQNIIAPSTMEAELSGEFHSLHNMRHPSNSSFINTIIQHVLDMSTQNTGSKLEYINARRTELRETHTFYRLVLYAIIVAYVSCFRGMTPLLIHHLQFNTLYSATAFGGVLYLCRALGYLALINSGEYYWPLVQKIYSFATSSLSQPLSPQLLKSPPLSTTPPLSTPLSSQLLQSPLSTMSPLSSQPTMSPSTPLSSQPLPQSLPLFDDYVNYKSVQILSRLLGINIELPTITIIRIAIWVYIEIIHVLSVASATNDDSSGIFTRIYNHYTKLLFAARRWPLLQ